MKKQYQLPREFGEKWVNELRSGKYKHTHTALSLGSTIHGKGFDNTVSQELRRRIAVVDNDHTEIFTSDWILGNVEFI